MYREYVISTNPYSYWPLDEVHGAADVMSRSTAFASITVPVATGTAPKRYHPLVPGYHSSQCLGSTSTVGRGFGTGGKENIPFTIDGWFLLHPDNNASDHGTINLLSLGTNQVLVGKSNLYVNFPGVLQRHFNVEDYDSGFYFALTWTGSVVSVYVNGEQKFVSEASGTPAFTNTSSVFTISAARASNVSIYDRALTQQNIYDKYMMAKSISHRDACANDGGQVFEMRINQGKYYDIDVDQEFVSSYSYHINIDEDGKYSNKQVDPLSYDVEPNWTASGVEIGAGEHLYVPALGYLGSDQWVIYIETSDDNSRAGDEYIFSLVGDRQRTECYVDSANDIHIDVIDIDGAGAETTTSITFDDSVDTSTGNFIFIYSNGRISAKTGDPVFTLNPVGGQDGYDKEILIDSSTILVIGADSAYSGNAVPKMGYLATHDKVLSDIELGSNYESYYDDWLATGIWPLTNAYENVGLSESYLVAKILMPDDEEIKSAYAISDGVRDYLAITTSEGTAYINTHIAPITSIPLDSTPPADFDQEIEVIAALQPTIAPYANASNYPSFTNVKIRAFTDRKILAETTEAQIEFTGAGSIWINSNRPKYFSRNKYDGLFFDSGTVGGVIEDPNIDGVDTHYVYRAVEFLMYIDIDLVNTGRIISIYDGSTERYISVNAGSNAMSHNFTSLRINDIDMAGKNITNLYNQWVHVYAELPAQLTDKQMYVGKAYNNANYLIGVGLQNLATYETPLSSSNITEHYSAFLGRYKYGSDVIDSITMAQNQAPNIYAPAWHTNVIPV